MDLRRLVSCEGCVAVGFRRLVRCVTVLGCEGGVVVSSVGGGRLWGCEGGWEGWWLVMALQPWGCQNR